MRLILNLLIFALAVASFQSCVSKKKFDDLQSQKDALSAQLGETEAKVAQLENQNSELQKTLESEKERLNGEIASLRSDMDATKSQMAQVQEKLNMTESELTALQKEINGMFDSYSDSGLKLEARDGRLFVISEQVKYRSGSSRLTRDERKALDGMAEKLKANSDIRILVEGHTDNVPFKADIAMDNWDLSAARAMNIVRYLVKQGVSPAQVAAVARGDSHPAASNDTADGKAQNRRSVVLPNPNLGGLMKKN